DEIVYKKNLNIILAFMDNGLDIENEEKGRHIRLAPYCFIGIFISIFLLIFSDEILTLIG
ncbi:MAG: hypothetical protein KAJ51_02320, partial [Thermoplasmata archaeon]|nr:hypothetical protein [Thermoplasmata archaeon]